MYFVYKIIIIIIIRIIYYWGQNTFVVTFLSLQKKKM
jgi:hypothetical protein